MTIQEALKLNSKIEAELLLTHVLKKPKEFLFLHPQRKISSEHAKKFKQLVKRRQKGEPVAYLVGYKYFYGHQFLVNKNVLIPRPETEWLVDRASQICKQKLQGKQEVIKVLDMGTGSGCIAISLRLNFVSRHRLRISASDISTKALTVAKKNAQRHHAKVKFINSDLFADISEKFDLIIANLPYVPLSDYKKLKTGLRFEPRRALTDNTNTFQIYRDLLKQVDSHLADKGIVLMEIDPQLPGKIKGNFKLYKDNAGRVRYAVYKKLAQEPTGP